MSRARDLFEVAPCRAVVETPTTPDHDALRAIAGNADVVGDAGGGAVWLLCRVSMETFEHLSTLDADDAEPDFDAEADYDNEPAAAGF